MSARLPVRAVLREMRIDYRMPLDATDTGFPSGEFDYVMSANAFEHIPKAVIQAILRESHGILRSDGRHLHHVDVGDHFSIGSDITTVNFLKYSQAQWYFLGGVGCGPCMAVSGFFIRGVGLQPREPVVLTAKHGARWGTTVVDPALHTLDLRPVVRIPPHGEDLPVEAHISVVVASNGADFIVLAITRRPEGYVAFSFLASRQRYGWNRVPEDGEALFYVIDDPVSYRSGCREGPAY